MLLRITACSLLVCQEGVCVPNLSSLIISGSSAGSSSLKILKERRRSKSGGVGSEIMIKIWNLKKKSSNKNKTIRNLDSGRKQKTVARLKLVRNWRQDEKLLKSWGKMKTVRSWPRYKIITTINIVLRYHEDWSMKLNTCCSCISRMVCFLTWTQRF
jgi:hypothetical protein